MPAPSLERASARPAPKFAWPALPLDAWRDTYATLHMWTQIVGKIRLACMPMQNQWWQVPLYVTTRGLGTSPMPYRGRTFEIDFDFVDHELVVRTSEGHVRALPLLPRPVRELHAELFAVLGLLGIDVKIRTSPVEVEDPIPFEEDDVHRAYDPDAVRRYFEILRRVDVAFERFRARFAGKCSPVHFWWGAFDLAVTRFSGRPAPPRPGADRVQRLAYDQECSSLGFWPGGGAMHEAAFYAYTVPAPEGYRTAPVRPRGAYYSDALEEFILPYDCAREAEHPEEAILEFAQSTYEIGATLGGWDRAGLEARFD